MWILTKFLNGNTLDLSFLERDGRCEVKKFIEELKKNDLIAYKTLMRLFIRSAELGVPNNKTQCRKVRTLPAIYEFKVPHVRVFWFFKSRNPRDVILSHGMRKGTTKEQDKQIAQAIKRYNDFHDQNSV